MLMYINSFTRLAPIFLGKQQKSRELRVGEDPIFVNEYFLEFRHYFMVSKYFATDYANN